MTTSHEGLRPVRAPDHKKLDGATVSERARSKHALEAIYASCEAASSTLNKACHEGCHRCCYTPPSVLKVEMDQVRLALGALPKVESIRRAKYRIEHMLGPCPALSGEGGCMIYADRPFSCRSLFSDSEDECQRNVDWGIENATELLNRVSANSTPRPSSYSEDAWKNRQFRVVLGRLMPGRETPTDWEFQDEYDALDSGLDQQFRRLDAATLAKESLDELVLRVLDEEHDE